MGSLLMLHMQIYRKNVCSYDLTETSDFVYAVAVKVSLLGLALGGRIALVGARVAGAGASFGRAGLGVLPFAIATDAADEGVGAGGDDGPVVVGVGVCCAGDGGEEGIGRVAVPAGGLAHGAGVYSPWTDGTDTGVSVFVVARGAAYVPEIRVVAREGLLHGVLADDGVGVAEDVTDVVAGPLTDWVCFEDRPAVFYRVGLVAYTYLSVPLPELHAAFGRSVAAGHDAAVAVGFVEGNFLAGPVDDSIGGGCLGQAVGLFVGEQWGCGRQEEEGRVYGSHSDLFYDFEKFAGLVGFAESGGWELNWEMRWFGGLASRVDCKYKGVNIGKSEKMNVVCNSTARGKEEDSKTRERYKREKGAGGGHVDLVVRNVRFGNLGWLLVGLARIWARIDFVRLTASPVPTNGMRRLFSNPGATSSHHQRSIIVSIISMRWWSAHAAISLFHKFLEF